MIGQLAKLAIRVALTPADLAARLALDVLFGKEEPFDYPLTGTSPAPLDTCAAPLCPGVASCDSGWEGLPCYIDLPFNFRQPPRDDVRAWCR